MSNLIISESSLDTVSKTRYIGNSKENLANLQELSILAWFVNSFRNIALMIFWLSSIMGHTDFKTRSKIKNQMKSLLLLFSPQFSLIFLKLIQNVCFNDIQFFFESSWQFNNKSILINQFIQIWLTLCFLGSLIKATVSYKLGRNKNILQFYELLCFFDLLCVFDLLRPLDLLQFLDL